MRQVPGCPVRRPRWETTPWALFDRTIALGKCHEVGLRNPNLHLHLMGSGFLVSEERIRNTFHFLLFFFVFLRQVPSM